MIFNSSKYNSHWQDKELSDLGSFRRGKSRHRPRNDPDIFKNGVYPLIQTGEIKQANLYIDSHNSCYNDLGLLQSKLWPKNTLCITIAANIAETALLGYPMCFPDSVVGFNAYQDESSELFMHYVFTYIRKAIQNSASGSIQDNINIDYLTSLKFKVPLKIYQDKVVSVLSALDKKIDLNNRINAELEAMAKTLYDYWFVQFDFPDANGKPYKTSGGKMVYNPILKREIPAGWEVGSASKLFYFNPTTPLTIGCFASYVDMDSLPVKGFMTKKIQKKMFTGGTKFIRNDVAVARITPCLENGKTGLISRLKEGEVGFGSTEFIILRGKEFPLSGFGACLARSDSFRQYAISNMTGTSGRKRIESKILETYNLPIPSKNLLMKFENTVKPFFDIMTSKSIENDELAALRDWLLPMLMNGQVTVK
ncbi:restriction endonuclease subunit S [Brenneria goodwinii]|uniref:restriction endonuclease subunit S n=1 Tax=Brenneria goodwinii TaxID=1109412 RepID=UPI0036EBDC15